MATLNNVKSTGVETAKDMGKKTRSLVRTASARAQKGGEQTYQQTRRGLRRVQMATTVGGALLQGWLLYNKQRARKNQREATHQAQHMQHNAQKKLEPAWSKMQEVFLEGREVAQEMLEKQAKNASKQLKKAQKNVQHIQKAAQENVKSGLSHMQEGLESGWSTTQDILEEGSRQMQKGLTQLGANARDARKTVRKRYKHARRKRARARKVFRWGVVIGIVLAFLFTPVPGSEVRRRLMSFWQECRQYLAQGQD